MVTSAKVIIVVVVVVVVVIVVFVIVVVIVIVVSRDVVACLFEAELFLGVQHGTVRREFNTHRS